MRAVLGVVVGILAFALSGAPALANKVTSKEKKAVSGKSSPAKRPGQQRGKAPAAKAAKAAAVPEPALPPLSESQIKLAELVQTGRADCEFQQSILVEPDSRQPGAFRVSFQRKTYRMVPEETSTGAVRLYDPDAGVAWLQIPMKSMLMNTRAGQRMVDACTSPTQRMVQAEAQAAEKMRPAGQLATPVLLVDPATAATAQSAAAQPGQPAPEPTAAAAPATDAAAAPTQPPQAAGDATNATSGSAAAAAPPSAAAPAAPADPAAVAPDASSGLSGGLAAAPDKPGESPPRN